MNEELNIPIYRAKKIDSGEYVKNITITSNKEGKVWLGVDSGTLTHWIPIDLSTLAIHFPDMIDSNGTKIFASLSEDGKGGDVITSFIGDIEDVLIYKNRTFVLLKRETPIFAHFDAKHTIKITGIQE